MSAERDSKGRFLKGSSGNPKTQFSGGVAEEMQARAVQSRKEKKALAEVVREALEKKVKSGNITKLEYLVEKAITNHAMGEMTFKDLRELQKLFGEDKQTLKLEGDGLRIIVENGEQAKKIEDIGEIG